MDYGIRKPHISGPDDKTILRCGRCGWRSGELSVDQMRDRGIPWYCDQCGGTNLHFVKFAPSERDDAIRLI